MLAKQPKHPTWILAWSICTAFTNDTFFNY